MSPRRSSRQASGAMLPSPASVSRRASPRHPRAPCLAGKARTSPLRQPPSTVWPDESRAFRAKRVSRSRRRDARRIPEAGRGRPLCPPPPAGAPRLEQPPQGRGRSAREEPPHGRVLRGRVSGNRTCPPVPDWPDLCFTHGHREPAKVWRRMPRAPIPHRDRSVVAHGVASLAPLSTAAPAERRERCASKKARFAWPTSIKWPSGSRK